MSHGAAQAGDLILDRYCPELSAEEREHARERLRALAAILIRINDRLTADIPSADSTHKSPEGTIPSLPQA